jgi:transcriptional regulator with XRE-family HTH domain
MKERLLEFLRSENKSSAQLAEEIGVQPSGISHILSGRNNPSLDFVLKMLEKYPYLSTDWLLFGKGTMYKEPKEPGEPALFDTGMKPVRGIEPDIFNVLQPSGREKDEKSIAGRSHRADSGKNEENDQSVIRIVWFYGDNSFSEYYPRG